MLFPEQLRPFEHRVMDFVKRLEDFLDETDFETPVIIWFDYTDPKGITAQIERFSRTIGTVPIGSVLRVTLNANPACLGSPDPEELSVELEGEASENRGRNPTLQEWRLVRFKGRLASLCPSDVTPDDMTFKKYGPCLLRALKLAVDNEVLSFRDRRIVWALATHYADGQAMITATLIVAPKDDTSIEDLVKSWEFYATTDAPHRIDLPALSTLERLTMESNANAENMMGFKLPKSEMGEDPFETFQKFYRIYPHFSRVEL